MYSILVVDDEPIIRRGLSTMIHRLSDDFQVAGEAQGGIEALEMLDAVNPDVVITDIRMPLGDGMELVKALRERENRALVVILTGYNDFTYAQTAVHFGVFDFLLKPVVDEQLKSTLSSLNTELTKRNNNYHMKEYLNLLLSGKISFLFASDILQELIIALKLLDLFKAEKVVDDLFGYLRTCALSPVHIFRLLQELYAAIAVEMKVPVGQQDMPESLLQCGSNNTEERQLDWFRSWFLGKISEMIVVIKKRSEREESVQIQKIKSYIKTHFAEDITLAVLSEKFYLNPNYLSSLFKQQIGKNFIDYLTEIRLTAAIDLLKEDNLTIGAIASMVGYEGSNHFSRLFKKYAGISPGEYRKTLGLEE